MRRVEHVRWDWAALSVHQIIGERAASLGLGETAAQPDATPGLWPYCPLRQAVPARHVDVG